MGKKPKPAEIKIKILELLLDEVAPTSFTKIDGNVDFSSRTVSKYLKKLTKKEYIKKVGKGKKKLYQITEKGKEELSRLESEKSLEDKTILPEKVKEEEIDQIHIPYHKKNEDNISTGTIIILSVPEEEKEEIVNEIKETVENFLSKISDLEVKGVDIKLTQRERKNEK